ncbi:MAG: hypothetical protein QHC40_07920 [Sphingobium sp.]|nr:hypothetical protein [Sphingobium sp.]
MQLAFGFGADEDMLWVRDQLRYRFGLLGPGQARTPIGQLVKSMISGRTRDEISGNAYERLIGIYPRWSALAEAPIDDVQAVIGEVTFPDVKALHLSQALPTIAAFQPDFDLAFLAHCSVDKALEWLEQLPGVGRKVSASTLNFSTLNMPAFVVDSHVLRILRRFGFVRNKADTRTAYDAVMSVSCGWSADDLAELHIVMKRLGRPSAGLIARVAAIALSASAAGPPGDALPVTSRRPSPASGSAEVIALLLSASGNDPRRLRPAAAVRAANRRVDGCPRYDYGRDAPVLSDRKHSPRERSCREYMWLCNERRHRPARPDRYGVGPWPGTDGRARARAALSRPAGFRPLSAVEGQGSRG